MHDSAYKLAIEFYNKYCKSLSSTSKVVDFGSYDVNGSMKPIFSEHGYIGMDMEPGPNVDVVCKNSCTPFHDNSIDVVISSSCFEHDECFWETFLEMCRIVKEHGYIYINAPSSGPYHAHPQDCWRFYADSWKALAKWANSKGYTITLLESKIDDTSYWHDSWAVFRKLA